MSDIDKIFKQAAQNKKGEFKPAYWDEMAMLINKDKKKRRGFIWFFIGAGALLITGAVMFYASKEANYGNLADNYIPRKINSDLEVNNEAFQQVEIEDKNLTDKYAINPINNKSYKGPKNTVMQNGQINKSDIQKKQAKILNNSVKEVLVAESSNSSYNIGLGNNNKTTEIDHKNNSLKEFKPITFSTYKMEEYSYSELDEMPLSFLVKDTNNEITQKKASQTSTNDFDKHNINVLLGISLYDDFNVASKEIDLKTGFVGGIEYVYRLNSRLSLSNQIKGYNRKSSNARLLFNTSEQSFGETTKEAIYDYSNLYFVEIPLSLNYHLAQKHRVGLGVNYTRLITTKVNVVKQRSELFLNTQTSQTTQQYVYHFDTFTLNNYGVNINYEYNLNRFKLGLEYYLGINNFINKQTFKTNYNNSLNQLNFILKYNVFKIEK